MRTLSERRKRYRKDIYMEVCGYYVFRPSNQGFMYEYALREIADYLDELNEPWDKQVKEYFEQQRNKELPDLDEGEDF